MTSATSSKTVGVVHQLSARYGLLVQVVMDNGTQFVAEEFKALPTASPRGLSRRLRMLCVQEQVMFLTD